MYNFTYVQGLQVKGNLVKRTRIASLALNFVAGTAFAKGRAVITTTALQKSTRVRRGLGMDFFSLGYP